VLQKFREVLCLDLIALVIKFLPSLVGSTKHYESDSWFAGCFYNCPIRQALISWLLMLIMLFASQSVGNEVVIDSAVYHRVVCGEELKENLKT